MAEEKSSKQPSLTLANSQSVQTDDGITLAFATPVLRMTLPGAQFLNKGLRKLALDLEKKSPGRTVSNAGGWQSEGNLFALAAPESTILQQAIDVAYRSLCRSLAADQPERAEDRLTITGWVNVNRDGDFNRIHSHGGVHWSGVYYVAGGDTGSGELELIDPRHLHGATPVPGFALGHRMTVQPEPGVLVLFPGWLEHWVTPARGAGERISIAFNIVASANSK